MTKKKFEKYVAIQESGRTNMLDIQAVIALSRWTLTEEDCFDIMENYAEYDKKWGKK